VNIAFKNTGKAIEKSRYFLLFQQVIKIFDAMVSICARKQDIFPKPTLFLCIEHVLVIDIPA